MTHAPGLYISFEELCQSALISSEHLRELIDLQIILPLSGAQAHEWQFSASSLSLIKKALRLHHDLELDWQATAVVLDLIEERDYLQLENAALRHCLQRHWGE